MDFEIKRILVKGDEDFVIEYKESDRVEVLDMQNNVCIGVIKNIREDYIVLKSEDFGFKHIFIESIANVRRLDNYVE